MGRSLSLLGAAGAGAAAMYFLDPERGTRRRALLRDQLVKLQHNSENALETTMRDLEHRLRGAGAEALARLSAGPVDDVVLAERVRSRLGRAVSHPGAIRVMVQDGRVQLGGPVLADEVDRLLARVRMVRGVREVIDDLDAHERPDDVPDLQGQRRRTGETLDLLQENWSPTTRMLTGALGGWMIARGLGRGGLVGSVAGLVGVGLVTRGVTNVDLRRLAGLSGRHSIDVRKTIRVGAPIDEIFGYWSNLENFPLFMEHVREVRRIADDRYSWTVAGPAGTSVHFETVITRLMPNRAIAWKTVPGETVGHAGVVRFDSEPDGSTRITVRMSYSPPAGAVGHAVASLFGDDPKHAMDADLVRFKSLVEEGKATAHGGTVTRGSVEPGQPS